MILEGTELEIGYARDTMPRGVLGMNAAIMEAKLTAETTGMFISCQMLHMTDGEMGLHPMAPTYVTVTNKDT
jgi:hypothetical protein